MSDISIGHNYDVNTLNSVAPNFKAKSSDDDNSVDMENPFAYALLVLGQMALVLQMMSNYRFKAMEDGTNRARNTQGMSNRMDEVIAEAAKGDDKTRKPVPDDVIKYMRDNGILVDGMTIDDYIKKHGDSSGLDKGSLQAIKAALDNSANKDTDMMTQNQLEIQRISQELSALNTQMAGLTSKWGDMLGMIAQKMY